MSWSRPGASSGRDALFGRPSDDARSSLLGGGGGGGSRPTPPPPNPNPNSSSSPRAPAEKAYYAPPRGESAGYPSAGQQQGYGGGGGGSGGGAGGPLHLTVVKLPNEQFAYANAALISEQDWLPGPRYRYADVIRRGSGHAGVFCLRPEPSLPPGSFAISGLARTWAQLAVNDSLQVDWISRPPIIGTIDIELGWTTEMKAHPEQYDSDKLAADFLKTYSEVLFAMAGPALMAFAPELKGTVTSLAVLDINSGQSRAGQYGILTPQTVINFRRGGGARPVNIKASSVRASANAIIKPDFKFEDMGIGGLDEEFNRIFRRAFASRIFPAGLVADLGIQHVKGLILHGPPGTGKTLIARQIGKMLNAREPKVVNGPEILNKFVGQSEENIRKLFAEAEAEYKAKGDDSELHIIIFDELDAICKQRGSAASSTGVGDSVVNQLLSKMDGVDQLNNILVIGMTNRLDMIDEALLRPGRLEVHVEISLPDEKGRVQILKIHTAAMRSKKLMAPDVNIEELAQVTKNFSGAEIGGLVKSATSFAFNRHVKAGTTAGVADDVKDLKITRADFMSALDEVKPAFGVAEDELKSAIPNGIITYAPKINEILENGKLFVEQVRSSQRTPLVSVLVHGPPSTGKTALAAEIAIRSDYPFIKLISPKQMVGMSDGQKIDFIRRSFENSYKSPLSVVVVDNIERIIEWVPIGARFSNPVLQALMVFFANLPPKGHRLLILATTSNRAMVNEMDMADSFTADIRVPTIENVESLMNVVNHLELFSSAEEEQEARGMLAAADQSARSAPAGQRVVGYDGSVINIGVKKLLSVVEMSRQAQDRVATLVSHLTLNL